MLGSFHATQHSSKFNYSLLFFFISFHFFNPFFVFFLYFDLLLSAFFHLLMYCFRLSFTVAEKWGLPLSLVTGSVPRDYLTICNERRPTGRTSHYQRSSRLHSSLFMVNEEVRKKGRRRNAKSFKCKSLCDETRHDLSELHPNLKTAG